LLFINFGQTHSFSSFGTMEIVNCLINPEFIDLELIHSENAFELLALSFFEKFQGKIDRLIPMISYRGIALIEIEALITNMLREFSEKSINYTTALKGYLLVFLTKIFREMQQKELGKILKQMNKLTPDILKYIEDNCFEKITLNELAQKCFYNPSYFSKIFKDFYGKNLMDFINEKRIQEALRLLKETSLSIEFISHRVGYNDRKQFYKVFKGYMGITPSVVRSTIIK
jgi:AraC family transcriptional regulator, L-rhamnose operon transcriptional activator RhaR